MENNIKMNYYLDSDKWVALMNMVMGLRVPQSAENFFITSGHT